MSTDSKTEILIVEDDANMARSIQRILDKAGYKTSIAADGFEAGLQLGRHAPDIITLDLQMPDMNGHELLECIEELEHLQNIKILLITAMPKVQINAALKHGAHDVIEKPFDSDLLLDKIEKLTRL